METISPEPEEKQKPLLLLPLLFAVPLHMALLVVLLLNVDDIDEALKQSISAEDEEQPVLSTGDVTYPIDDVISLADDDTIKFIESGIVWLEVCSMTDSEGVLT